MKKIIITIEEENDDAPRLPWNVTQPWDNSSKYYNPCENCPNNPLNNPNATGFCNCALPALCNPMY